MIRALVIAFALVLAASSAPSANAAPASNTITLKGPSGSKTIGAADLAAGPRVAVIANFHGKRYRFEGVPLHVLLAKVGAPSGEKLRGGELTNVVIASASDGYQVVLALAEIDPSISKKKVIVADKADGKPLSAEDGPYRLVVQDDLRPARSARMVSMIEVKRLGPARAPGH